MSCSHSSSITQWPSDERPYERLWAHGASSLSPAELMAVIIGTGIRGCDAVTLSRRLLVEAGGVGGLEGLAPERIAQQRGWGRVKAARLTAALELGRRVWEARHGFSRGQTIHSAQEAAKWFHNRMKGCAVEVFDVMLLDGRHRVLDLIRIEKGTVNKAYPILREIFAAALIHAASAIICAHNHPSGDITPSEQDRAFTRRLQEAGRILDCSVLDHLIITEIGYYSLVDERGRQH